VTALIYKNSLSNNVGQKIKRPKQDKFAMTKKDIKIFFKAISDRDFNKISELTNSNPEYLKICNVAPPTKDDGQSGLQVSFKTGNFEIAKHLIDKGADVNFMETSEINEWTAPVLHDCIRATIFNSYTLQKDTKHFDKAFSLLELMLSKKADPNSTDSYGNTCLHRAILDARQMLDNPSTDLSNDILIGQLRSVFNALIKAGGDTKKSSEKRESAEELYLNFKLDKYKLW
jgi:ankyrin repeat protein